MARRFRFAPWVSALAMLAACRPEPPPRWIPAIRLVERPAPSDLRAGLAWGARVAVGGVERRVLTTPVPAPPIATIPALTERDVASDGLVVPPNAFLEFAVAVDGAVPWADTPALEFQVSAFDDERETVIDRVVVDPAHEPSHRTWRDRRVALAPFAGKRVRLRFVVRPAADRANANVRALPLWGAPTVTVPGPVRGVVLISLDTLRAASVRTYGARRNTTPQLDSRVAAAGVVFERAYATAPHTLPSHVSVFTGLWARTHGIVGYIQQVRADVPMLPELLQTAGFATAAFTEDGYIVPQVGFRRGFDAYSENTSPDFREPVGHSAMTLRAGAEWLARHGDRPFFLFLHTYEVHAPYTPRPPYDRALEDPALRFAGDEQELLRYEQEARYLDDQLGTFLDALDAMGLAERTLLIVMSDHGEEFGEHGATTHGFQLYDESIRVPLVMRLPDTLPAGRRVADVVSLVDVLPTITDLVGLPAIPGLDGTSLVPLVLGTQTPVRRDAVFAECHSSLEADIDTISVCAASYHCIVRLKDDSVECYDPALDVAQRAPLPSDAPQVADARARLAPYLDIRPKHTLPPRRPRPPDARRSGGTDAEREEKLRALGYVE